MNLKNSLIPALAITTLTLTACSTAPRLKSGEKATPYAVIDYSRVFGYRSNAGEGDDIALATYRELKTLGGTGTVAAEDLLEEGRALTGLKSGDIESVCSKMSKEEKVEFLKKFRAEDAHISFFKASPELEAISTRIDMAYTDLQRVGNTEQTASDIATHIQSGTDGVQVPLVQKQQVATLLSQTSGMEKNSAAYVANTSAVQTWAQTGILTLTPEACKNFSVDALENSARNQKEAEALAESLSKKYPKDVEKRKSCFEVLEAQRFFSFVQNQLGGTMDDAIALAADCHQTATESLGELQKMQAGNASDASSCQ